MARPRTATPGPSEAQRYDRLARIHQLAVAPMDWFGGSRRRKRLLRRARGRTLEIGIGTGRNLCCYAPGVTLVGVDVSLAMLGRARRRAARLGATVKLEQADVARLPFADASFDTVTATDVFCSVADPVRGLEEIWRVVKPKGRVLLLEHVRPQSKLGGWIADRLTVVTRRFGPELNRHTDDSVRIAGLELLDVHREGVWREMVARRPSKQR